MLFKMNMYRLGSERREAERRRIRSMAFLALVVCVNLIVMGLFAQSVFITMESAIAATQTRLHVAQDAMVKMTGNGRTLSDEQRELLRTRIGRASWSSILNAVASDVPNEMWLTRMTLSERRTAGAARTSGLHLEGVVRAPRRDDSSEIVMDFVQRLREDERFAAHFSDVKLSTMDWSSKTDTDLEFEILCQMSNGEE